MPHYTSTDQDALVERITSDFIGQIAQRLETSHMSQIELAEKLGVTESDVSQVLNLNRINLTFKTMVRYAFAAGMKAAVVAYDDGDPTNQNGPVGSEIFNLSWERLGKPRDIWAVNEANCATKQYSHPLSWTYSWTNSTFASASGTIGGLLPIPLLDLQEKATLSNARNQELHV